MGRQKVLFRETKLGFIDKLFYRNYGTYNTFNLNSFLYIGLLVVLGKEIKIKGTTKKNSKELKSFVKYI